MHVSSISPATPSSFPPRAPSAFPHHPTMQRNPLDMLFSPFSSRAFSLAIKRHVPLFLVIGDISNAFLDPSVCAQLMERTVPVHLLPGYRPDVELLCRRAAALYSGEDGLPLCALLLENGLPFLSAPLPPPGFALDPSRLFIWLTHADRRFMQNRAAFTRQAYGVLRSFDAPAPAHPCTPQDAAHTLLRAALSAADDVNGGFGKIKSPQIPLLRFLAHEASRSSRSAHAALIQALDAMRTSELYDPVDGLFFASTLTEDWRVFVPRRPLAINALLALTLLQVGRREEAVRILDALLQRFSLPDNLFAPMLSAPPERYAFSADQICSLLGDEDGLRACRLLSLLQRSSHPAVTVAPSRFSPPPKKDDRPSLDQPSASRCPVLPKDITPEDQAFIRRILPALSRARAARMPERPCAPPLTADCALAAAVLSVCGRKLGEQRYMQAAHRIVSALFDRIPLSGEPGALAYAGADGRHGDPPSCLASCALCFSALTLAAQDPSSAFASAGLRLLGSTLHAFVREDGMLMHTPADPASPFPRVPAIFDGELPSPAALLVLALTSAQTLRPDAPYRDAIDTLFSASAPYMRHHPLACAALIDAFRQSSDNDPSL